MSSANFQCAVCLQPSGEEQPTFCLHCFIPITAYKHGKYIARFPIAPSAQIQPKLTVDQAVEAVEDLGINHLPVAEQAVALASLAREKMNPMSGDYEFNHASQLIQLAKLYVNETAEQWAHDMVTTIYAMYLTRVGHNELAVEQLEAIVSAMPVDTEIESLRRLEVIALLAFSSRLAGNSQKADTYISRVLEEVSAEYEKLEVHLARYLEEANIKSEYLGLNNRQTRFPRLDYYTRILSVLVEESIVRGGKQTPLPDDTLDRMLELDNVTHQLARISPPDDPGFFAAQLREYLRLFNGIFWYGDIMINNDGTKRRLLIERTYTRILEWMEILPAHFWLSLRLSRFLEIFVRAEAWSDNIKVEQISSHLIEKAPMIQRPSFYYVFAEFNANAGRYDEALKNVAQVLSPNYEKDLDPTLQSMAQRLQQSIELERVGILMGVSKPNDWLEGLIEVDIQELDMITKIELDTANDLIGFGIAIFGDRLLEHHEDLIAASLIQVGPRRFDAASWDTNFTDMNTRVEGWRMDALVIQLPLADDRITLLFEGKKQQQIALGDLHFRLEPSELLLLRAIKHTKELRVNDIIQLLADLLTGHLMSEIQIYTLKSPYTS